MTTPRALLVFGDSLSDAGRAYDLSGRVLKVPIPPDSAGYNGWFSNGLIQSEVAAGALSVPATVYAVGGARAVGSRTVQQYLDDNGYDTPEIMLPNPDPVALATDTFLGGQVGQYLFDASANPPAPGTAASIWIGANDLNALPLDASPELVAQTIAAIMASIAQAAGAIALTGVDRILLYNLPAPEFLPLPLPPQFGQVVEAFNGALAGVAAFLGTLNIDAEIVDMNRIAAEIDADPRAFGLNPAYMDQPLLLGLGSQPIWIEAAQNWFIPPNPVVADAVPSTVAYTDFLHPSSATHGVLGIFVADFLGKDPTFLGDGNDVRWFGPADDFVLGGGGNDVLFTRGGADTVLAGTGNDRVFTGSGDDIAVGGAGNDLVWGGGGDDVVAGSDGDDRTSGGAGRDLMVDGLGWDLMHGDSGSDAFVYAEAALTGGDNATDGGRFLGGRGYDTLYLALTDATRAAVEAELMAGSRQSLTAIGVTTRSIEAYAFVDPADIAAGIDTPADLKDADLWGIV